MVDITAFALGDQPLGVTLHSGEVGAGLILDAQRFGDGLIVLAQYLLPLLVFEQASHAGFAGGVFGTR